VIITVASFKGGVGKTTAAVHLAAYLCKKGTAVLVDGDINRSATGWNSRGELPFPVIEEKQARDYVDRDYMVIDTQARPQTGTLKQLAESDLLVVPVTPDALGLHGLMHTAEELEKLKANFKALLSIVPPKPSRTGQKAREALKDAGIPMLKAEIRRLVAFQKAALAGTPVYAVKDPRAKMAWADYQKLGREVLR
jgi:chromosome partitioning protein